MSVNLAKTDDGNLSKREMIVRYKQAYVDRCVLTAYAMRENGETVGGDFYENLSYETAREIEHITAGCIGACAGWSGPTVCLAPMTCRTCDHVGIPTDQGTCSNCFRD